MFRESANLGIDEESVTMAMAISSPCQRGVGNEAPEARWIVSVLQTAEKFNQIAAAVFLYSFKFSLAFQRDLPESLIIRQTLE